MIAGMASLLTWCIRPLRQNLMRFLWSIFGSATFIGVQMTQSAHTYQLEVSAEHQSHDPPILLVFWGLWSMLPSAVPQGASTALCTKVLAGGREWPPQSPQFLWFFFSNLFIQPFYSSNEYTQRKLFFLHFILVSAVCGWHVFCDHLTCNSLTCAWILIIHIQSNS